MEILIWVGFALSLFGGSLMLAKQKSSTPDIVLTIWLLLFAFDFLLRAIEIQAFGHAQMSNTFLLFNPLLYLYTQSLTNSKFKLKWLHLLHLIPFIGFEIIVYSFSQEISLNAFISKTVTDLVFYSFTIISFLSWTYYNTRSAILLRKHNKHVEEEFSYKNRFNNISWLKFVAYFYFSYTAAIFIVGITFYFRIFNSEILVILVSSVSLFLVYAFSFFGLLQTPIFNSKTTSASNLKENISIPESKIQKIIVEIMEYCEKEEPYLESDFNMDSFSQKLKIPKHQLTWILNKEIGKNFFQFINEYRIREAKKMLSDKNNVYSIEAIGYDCGFNSKSSFFTTFKKNTGMTPLQYKKIIRNS